jgi:hypothetical protein
VDGGDVEVNIGPWESHIDSGNLDWIWDGRLRGAGYSDHDLATTARVFARVCPHCGAEPGAWYVNTGSGEVLDHLESQHFVRCVVSE